MADKFHGYMQTGLLLYIGMIMVMILLFANAMYIPHHWLKTPIYLTIGLLIFWIISMRYYDDRPSYDNPKKFITYILCTLLFGIWAFSALFGTVDVIYGGDKPPPEVAIIILVLCVGIFIFCSQAILYTLDEVCG